MFKQISLATIAITMLAMCQSASAQMGQRLKVSDPAPGLSIEEWVKGDETSLEDSYRHFHAE